MSNYPDDIRMYDDDPRSPFFTGDDWMDKPIEELVEDWANEIKLTGRIEEIDIDLHDIDALLGHYASPVEIDVYINDRATKTVRENPERFAGEPDYDVEWD